MKPRDEPLSHVAFNCCQRPSDPASLASVRAFAADYLARGAPLDVLVCNAVSWG